MSAEGISDLSETSVSESGDEVLEEFSHLAVLGLPQPLLAGGSLACDECVRPWTLGDGLGHCLQI